MLKNLGVLVLLSSHNGAIKLGRTDEVVYDSAQVVQLLKKNQAVIV